MTRNRYKAVSERGQPLHHKERKRGWHFCNELDGALSGHTPFCTCHGYGERKLKRIRRSFWKSERRARRIENDLLCDLADAIAY